jgi:hypothetical protein
MNKGPFAPIVIGIPRSGFSLLASILSQIFNRVPNKFDARCLAYRVFCDEYGKQISTSILHAFMRHGLDDEIIFNDNFRNMAGGPIWNNDEKGQRAYFRKYIGAGHLGDFTLLTSHPLGVLDQYQIVHSHGPFTDWLSLPHFEGYERLASIRNPTGIINSACHSLNALASEYIQKFEPDLDVEKARIELAHYKLTDIKFFDALLRPLKKGLEELRAVHDQYEIVAWEDMVTAPKETILKLTRDLDLPVTEDQCNEIWESIGFRNLTGAHKHNYRVGKAYVGDERESLTNEHIDIMKDMGFDELSEFFGYGKLEHFPTSDYTDFQKKVHTCLDKGEVYDPMEDRTLFNLAFNKSNIDFSGFGFRTYDWREHTRIERSNIEDPALEIEVSDAAERSVGAVSALFQELENAFQGTGSIEAFVSQARNMAFEFPYVDADAALVSICTLHQQFEANAEARSKMDSAANTVL